ncbi:growth/differentiation factor 7 [Choloepus didactylus]|uniref:growth/differentiation factor 7 n=1 Tax=Choloepus didactylus TaxID=27675 RepID=UPI00189F8E55|nr:growth/differentiation factor 7 [Choloepus didactylus]XP_037669342.1 growth/differentiation factor 7 [Choloepus didactylus]XP_037669343.1 growth/differentiation factor 7 [Choloepus didactylus]XP_037669344.1 growth/differentiation factor 7 [Choloepus didactylus]
MDLSAAAALCLWLLSACHPRDGLEAAAVLRAAGAGPAGGPRGGGGGGRTLAPAAGSSAAPAAPAPGARATARRASGPGFRNGSLVPHQFMMSLYRSLSGGPPAGTAAASGPGSGRDGRADTITGFADQATPDDSAAETGQRFLFDVSSLPDVDEVVGAELRVLCRGSPEPGTGSATAWPPRLLLLSTCPGAARAPRLLHSRAAEPLAGARWEVFDVADSVRRHRREPRASRALCLWLRAVGGPARSPLALRLLGFGPPAGGGAAAEERALLVVASRTQRKENLFREIRAQARALGEALAALPPPDPGPGPGSPRGVGGGRRRRRTALAGARAPQGSGGGVGRGHGRRGRSRCSRKSLHVDFKELGWDDWIIAPLDYEAYHCEGVCDFPLRSHLEPTNHAIIQTLLNSMAPDAAPASCCVPARLSPISILYIDAANNVVYKQYEDMVVEACGCR